MSIAAVREVGFNEVATTSLAAYDAAVKPGSFITQKYHEDHSDLKLIRSYGHQLVKNFNGLVGDNTNFSGFEATTDYAAEIAVAKTYKRTGYIATLCDEIVPITTRRAYDLSFDFWLYGSDWVTDRRFYVFTDFYDTY